MSVKRTRRTQSLATDRTGMRVISRVVLPNVNRECVLISLIFITNRTDPVSVSSRVILIIAKMTDNDQVNHHHHQKEGREEI